MNKKKKSSLKTVSIAAFTVIMTVMLLSGIGKMQDLNEKKAKESLENAIVQSSVHCYAVEGMYPESLDYLKEHYGISYDEERFTVKYEVIAQNIRPQIHVISRESQE